MAVSILLAAATLAGCELEEQTGGSSTTAGEGPKAETSDGARPSCGSKATDACTPRVAFGKTVRVDALIWSIQSVRTTKTLGNQQYGLGAKANGTFVVVKLKVRSDKNESVTLTGDVVKLETAGNTYSSDLDGTTAAVGADEDPFFLESLGPDSTTTGTVVFDVPRKVLGQKVELRFNELGFGSTRGYIRVPSSRLR